MTIETARTFFLWCSILNYAFLILWAVCAIFGRHWLHKLTGRLFHINPDQVDLLNVAGITLYKMGIFLFNIIPCIALYIMK